MKIVVNESANVTVMLKKKIKKVIVVTPIKKKMKSFLQPKIINLIIYLLTES
jgi:hypothetical protein